MIDNTTVFFILQNLSGRSIPAVNQSLFFHSQDTGYGKNKRFKLGIEKNGKYKNFWPDTQVWRTCAGSVKGAALLLAQKDEALKEKSQTFYDEPDRSKNGEDARYCFTSHVYEVLLDYGKRFNKDEKLVCEKVLALLKEFQVPEEQYNKAVEAANKNGKFSDLAYYIIESAKDAVNSTNRETQLTIYERYQLAEMPEIVEYNSGSATKKGTLTLSAEIEKLTMRMLAYGTKMEALEKKLEILDLEGARVRLELVTTMEKFRALHQEYADRMHDLEKCKEELLTNNAKANATGIDPSKVQRRKTAKGSRKFYTHTSVYVQSKQLLRDVTFWLEDAENRLAMFEIATEEVIVNEPLIGKAIEWRMPEPQYRTASPSALLESGFSLGDIASELYYLYNCHRGASNQPIDDRLDRPFWINLVQNHGDEQLRLLILRRSSNETRIIGFYWIKPFYSQTIVETGSIASLNWEALELSDEETVPPDVDPFLCILSFYIPRLYTHGPWIKSSISQDEEKVSDYLWSAFQEQLLQNANNGVRYSYYFCRAFSRKEKEFWENHRFSPVSKCSGSVIVDGNSRGVFSTFMALDALSMAPRGALRACFFREPWHATYQTLAQLSVALLFANHPRIKGFSYRPPSEDSAKALFDFSHAVRASSIPFVCSAVLELDIPRQELDLPRLMVESSMQFLLPPDNRWEVEDILAEINCDLSASHFKLVADDAASAGCSKNVYRIIYSTDVSIYNGAIATLKALVEPHFDTMDCYIETLANKLMDCNAEPVPEALP